MTRRRMLAAATLALALALGGCAMTPASRIDDHRATAEALADELIAAVPADLRDGDARVESGIREGGNASAQPQPDDTVWWDMTADVPLTTAADASASAAQAVAAHLEAEGWTGTRVREVDGGTTVFDGYRRELDAELWYIELKWVKTVPGKAEPFTILIAGPPTTRG